MLVVVVGDMILVLNVAVTLTDGLSCGVETDTGPLLDGMTMLVDRDGKRRLVSDVDMAAMLCDDGVTDCKLMDTVEIVSDGAPGVEMTVVGLDKYVLGMLNEMLGVWIPGVLYDGLGKLIDVLGMAAEVDGRLSDVLGKERDVLGTGTDGELSDVVGAEIDVLTVESDSELSDGRLIDTLDAESEGGLSDVDGKPIDVLDIDAVDRPGNVVGTLIDVPEKPKDVLGRMSDVLGRLTIMLESAVEVLGRPSEKLVKLKLVVGMLMEVVGRLIDVG